MEVNYYFNIVFDIGEKYSLSHEGVLTILNGGIIVDGDLSVLSFKLLSLVL